MLIQINASTFDGVNAITEDDRSYYESIIQVIIDKFKDGIEINNIISIIIPENYKEGLYQIQEKNGKKKGLTENEFAKGVAQIVEAKKCGYYIVIDKSIIFSIFDDNYNTTIKEKYNKDEIIEIEQQRQNAFYIIYHELCHVDEYNKNSKIKFMVDYESDFETVKGQLIELAKQCWSEYYACRKASNVLPINIDYFTEFTKTVNQVNEKLLNEKFKYQTRRITLVEFINLFHSYTNFLFKKIVSFFASIKYISDKNIEILEITELIENENIRTIILKISDEFDNIYKKYPEWDSVEIFNEITQLFTSYYIEIGIKISQLGKKTKYEIM